MFSSMFYGSVAPCDGQTIVLQTIRPMSLVTFGYPTEFWLLMVFLHVKFS
jgi:hypothetical protein